MFVVVVVVGREGVARGRARGHTKGRVNRMEARSNWRKQEMESDAKQQVLHNTHHECKQLLAKRNPPVGWFEWWCCIDLRLVFGCDQIGPIRATRPSVFGVFVMVASLRQRAIVFLVSADAPQTQKLRQRHNQTNNSNCISRDALDHDNCSAQLGRSSLVLAVCSMVKVNGRPPRERERAAFEVASGRPYFVLGSLRVRPNRWRQCGVPFSSCLAKRLL